MSKLCDIKDRLIDLMYDVVMSDDINNVCSKELYEVMDIIKDIEETKYYKSITDAMENADEPEKYVKKYIPEYESRMYFHKEKVTMDDVINSINEMMNSVPQDMIEHTKQELLGTIEKM